MDRGSPSIQVDRVFLNDVLQRSTDLAQLKATLYVLQRAGGGGARGVPLTDLLVPEVARTIARPNTPEPSPERVRRAVERALVDGLLLKISVHIAGVDSVYLLPATAANRAVVQQLRDGGEIDAGGIGLPEEGAVSIYRPNVFAAYERYIGSLTPLIAEQLRDAELSYPRGWIEDAIQIAAESNHRHWRYVQSILSRWEDDGAPGSHTA